MTIKEKLRERRDNARRRIEPHREKIAWATGGAAAGAGLLFAYLARDEVTVPVHRCVWVPEHARNGHTVRSHARRYRTHQPVQ